MVKKEVSHSLPKNDNSFGVTGVVLGIFSILSVGLGGILIGIIGLVFSLIQRKKYKNKWSTAGIVLNVVGIVLGILVVIAFVTFAADFMAELEALQGLEGLEA